MTEKREGPAATAELGLFRANSTAYVPRDRMGRFTTLKHSPQRIAILKKALTMRAAMGLPAAPALETALKRQDRNGGAGHDEGKSR